MEVCCVLWQVDRGRCTFLRYTAGPCCGPNRETTGGEREARQTTLLGDETRFIKHESSALSAAAGTIKQLFRLVLTADAPGNTKLNTAGDFAGERESERRSGDENQLSRRSR